jgi:diguanylate cyclase (GGDEF)-like protein/putative nucleotidyltransferase with HDIG domain
MAKRQDSDAVAMSPRARNFMRAAFAFLVAGLVLHVVHALTHFGGAGTDRWINDVDFDLMLVGSAAACLARAVLVPAERRTWAVLGAGLLLWASGDVSWSFMYAGLDDPPFPGLSDIGWLLFYPTAYVALGLLIKERVPRHHKSLWLDGAVGALAVASVVSAAIMPTITASLDDYSTAAVVTNLAYPVLDIVLIAFVIVAFSLHGWRPDRVWALLGAGLVCSAIADSWYVFQVAAGTYQEGSLLDSFWPAATILMALAAWAPARPPARVRIEGKRLLALPTTFALAAIGIATYDHFARVSNASLLLASAALVVVLVRLWLTIREHHSMLERTRHESMTDSLTGLGNRRQLMRDLGLALDAGDPRILAVFDLDGFKNYNDTFGHPAGDSLLNRLGHNLRETLAHEGSAYRMGGDEFCALIDAPATRGRFLVESAAAALCERGRGFEVGCSYGAVEMPDECRTASQALQLADRRLYRQKSGRSGSPRSQTRDVLLRVLEERQPEMREHLREVAALAMAVGHELGLANEELDELARAAELHDIGKMAVPDAILDKPEPLSEDEMAFIRRHTVIGEAILSVAPALVPVATLVRSSHERYDGKGYPDGLRGDAIPLGSRIVFACDAFDAITTNRPYQDKRTAEEAMVELRRCAGTQFDPVVVDAIGTVLRRRAVGDAAAADEISLTVPESLRPA